MKITDKIISLPPYISTTWSNVASIHMKGNVLVITLREGDVISIPSLKQEIIDLIFNTHASYLEKNSISQTPRTTQESSKISTPFTQSAIENGADMPFRLGFGVGFGAFDGLGSVMQHNPSQANAPDLPPEILNKIASIAKIIAPEDIMAMPKAEPHCNCVHCQIAQAINRGTQPAAESESAEEVVVSDAELQFQQWDISQMGDKLFSVINRLDNKEKFSVYLGHPIGCTCGKSGCEHILAVLKS